MKRPNVVTFLVFDAATRQVLDGKPSSALVKAAQRSPASWFYAYRSKQGQWMWFRSEAMAERQLAEQLKNPFWSGPMVRRVTLQAR